MDERYNISEVAKLLNISNELLRHYERKGLIAPTRDKKGYRYYTANDVNLLLGVRRFRNTGFSLEDVETLLYGASYEEMLELTERRRRELEEEIIWKQMVLDSVKELYEEWESLPEKEDVFTLCESPSMLRIASRNNSRFLQDDFSPAVLRWVDKMPVVWISPSFTQEAVEKGLEEVSFGYAVPLSFADVLDLSHTPGAVTLHPSYSVSFLVHSRGTQYLSAKLLRRALPFCENNGLKLGGDPWGLTIGAFKEQDEPVRYHRIYLPVKKA